MNLILNNIHLYFHTLRFLSSKQIFYRLFYTIKRKYYKIINPLINKKLSKRLKPNKLNYIELKPNPITHYTSSYEKLISNEFTFINQTISFGNKVDWHYRPLNLGTRLWKLNLNYHEYLIDIASLYKKTQKTKYINYIQKHIKEWTEQNPFGKGGYYKDNWNAYAISLRSIAWIKVYSLLYESLEKDFKTYFLNVLRVQLDYLKNNLEFDLKGNHLLENGFSLLFGAIFFTDEKLYSKAKKILYEQLEEQILEDGGHFELSPMYHQIILHRLLDGINLLQNNHHFENQNELLQLMEEKAKKMIGWLNQMTFSNGQIPMLNDSASGIAPTTQKLNNYAKSLDLTTETKPKEIRSNQCNLDDSGYRRFNGTNYECIIDIGPIAPSYQPGHAHADTFNFVLNLYNQPYIVDTGVSTYNPGETRLKERGTSAHNTVTIMDENSSEIWGSFRVARRAKVDIIKDHENHFIAQHNGYRKLKTIHQREWSFSESQINILDTIKGKCKEGKAHFWISPSIIPEIKNQKVYSENGVMTFQNAVSVELVGTQIPDGFNLFSDNYKIEVVFKHYLKTTIKIR